MFQISIPRIQRFALILGGVGTVLAAVLWGVPEAAAFLTSHAAPSRSAAAPGEAVR